MLNATNGNIVDDSYDLYIFFMQISMNNSIYVLDNWENVNEIKKSQYEASVKRRSDIAAFSSHVKDTVKA